MRAQRLVQRLQHLGGAQRADLADRGVEVLPEVAQQRLPVEVAGRHQVQLLFEIGGEVVLDVAGEELLEEGGDQPALVLGHETVALHAHILAVTQHGQDRGVGRGRPMPSSSSLFTNEASE